MTKKQYDYTVYNYRGKRLCETDDLREARRIFWRTPYAQHPVIVYSRRMMERLTAMQLSSKNRTINEDAFGASNVDGLVLCATIIPQRESGVPHESLTFVPPMCYRKLPPDERSALHAIKRTF